MKVISSAPRGKKHILLRALPLGALAVSAGFSLWHRHQARRCVSELLPPKHEALPTPAPHVSIILPVRNEAAHIDACLASLTAQEYPDFSIIVIDDGSTDRTPQILAEWHNNDPRVLVHRIDQLPAGWAGKAHALHTGVMLSRGEWLLFTDADTRHAPHTLRLMMAHALGQQDDLLSVGMNVMTLSGPATPLLMPVTEILLTHHVTPEQIKDPGSPRAFAFGQYMLLRKEAYLAAGGYDTPGMRACAVEDLALAEQIKQSGRRVEVIDGRGLIRNSQWTTWDSARQGWSKSCYSEIIRSRSPLVSLPAALALTAYGLGPLGAILAAFAGWRVRRPSLFLAGLTLLAQIDAKRRFDQKYGLSPRWALTAPIAWAISGIMMLDVTRQILTGRRAAWKGRQIPRQERATRLRADRARGRTGQPEPVPVVPHRVYARDHGSNVSPGGSNGAAAEGTEERARTRSSVTRHTSSGPVNWSRNSGEPKRTVACQRSSFPRL